MQSCAAIEPDTDTRLKSHRLPEIHDLRKALLSANNADLVARVLLRREDTLADATLIAAPASTPNAQQARGPERHHTKKGNP